MKNTFLRLSALVLALVMLLAVLGGCKHLGNTPDNGSGDNTVNTDTPNENENPDVPSDILYASVFVSSVSSYCPLGTWDVFIKV